MRQKCFLLLNIGVIIVFLISPSLSYADRRIGISPPNYDYVPVTPYGIFSGGFTVFNQGDEELQVYAEVHNAPGNVTIEWQHPNKEWKDTPEILIPAKQHRYGRFIIQLGELVQGQFYNWSIVSGYIETDPKVSVVAQAGFRICMIYPFPPKEPLKWYQESLLPVLFLILGIAVFIVIVVIRKIQELNRRDPVYVQKTI